MTTHKHCYWLLLTAILSLPIDAAESYTIDTEHSIVRFSISHFVFLTTPGHFANMTGKVTLDRVAEHGSMEVAVEASTVNTGHAKRDENLRSPDFFDTALYPQISYRGEVVKFINGIPVSVEGQLTLHGISKPVMLVIDNFKCDTDLIENDRAENKKRCSATASMKIKRSDFGMSYAIPLVGDEVMLFVEVQAHQD